MKDSSLDRQQSGLLDCLMDCRTASILEGWPSSNKASWIARGTECMKYRLPECWKAC
jgi:hypothetical protein